MLDSYAALADISAQIRQGTISAVLVVDACLARIQALNPRLNAFITITAEAARLAAAVAEAEVRAGRWRGPLHGVPVAVKDFYDTAGVKTTAASERFTNRVPARDADVVRRLKAAGAVVVGKTNMDTLGMATTGLQSFYGAVKNPWNADYIAGGSSSGSAAAVASGMCYATVDTDAIGSCRLPASCCGVVGFKGTYGLISTEGILDGEPPPDEMIMWLSHPGVTARRVADAALLFDALKQGNRLTEGVDVTSALNERRKLRVGVATNFKAEPDVRAAFSRAIEMIVGFGHVVKELEVPFAGPDSGTRNIKRDRETICQRLFTDVDVLLLPTTTTTVLHKNQAAQPQSLSPDNTVFANYYGLPAISVPCGFDVNGMPVGLQIVAKPTGDLDALVLVHEYEAAAGWFTKHPNI